MAERLGRNDPCWCGSGRKYKRCHLETDEKERVREEPAPDTDRLAARLRRRLGQECPHLLSQSETTTALSMYFGEPLITEMDDSDMIGFMDWMIHDYAPPRLGRTLLEEFLERNRRNLTEAERRLVEAWCGSRPSLYEVQEVRPGEGVRLQDLLAGGEFFVHDVTSSRNMVRWDCFLGRVENEEGTHVLSGVAHMAPRQISERLRSWILEDREASGLPWAEYLRENSHQIRLKCLTSFDQWKDSIQVVSAEGDPLVFSKAVYQVLDQPGVLDALRSSDSFVNESAEDGIQFDWLEGDSSEQGRRVLGTVSIARKLLTLECSTRQRLERGRKLIEGLAGEQLFHKGDRFTGFRQAMKKVKPPKDEESSPIPPEVEREIIGKYLAEHYAKWPDIPLPALDGKTPREAAHSKSGRVRLADLVKEMENHELRSKKEGRAWFDFSSLKAELGLEP